MDFGSLLNVAQKNEKTQKKEVKYYSTKFEPPKKEERSKELSSNIKKFLARKEAEERQARKEANLKREELLALRSQDKKATRRVQVMLKRTKSANKSVIQDAIDNDNTAVTLVGPSQPDEDDYGYVSQEASALYNKMMAKYSTMPDEPKFALAKSGANTNINGTKNRVKAALLREQEEALLPHKRKRKAKEPDSVNNNIDDHEERYSDNRDNGFKKPSEPKESKPKPRPAPPPMNFAELLKLAEKKQFEPIVIEPKKENKDEQPMTKRQKKEFEREREWKERKEKGLTQPSISSNPTKSDKSVMPPPNKIPKLNNVVNNKIPRAPDDRNRIPLKNNVAPIPHKQMEQAKTLNNVDRKQSNNKIVKRPDSDRRESFVNKPMRPQVSSDRDRSQNSKSNLKSANLAPTKNIKDVRARETVSREPKSRPSSNDQKSKQLLNDSRARMSDVKPKQLAPGNVRPKSLPPNDRPKQFLPGDIRRKQLPTGDIRPKQFPPADVKPKQFPPADVRPKQFPPADVRPKQFPPPDVQGRKFPPSDVRRKPAIGNKRRILDDDDEDYDSEMDDFIDDGPEEGADYSKYIKEIFGYDKSRYRNSHDDDQDMESSFSQMMKEEFISTKIGIMEDLEDMKQEAIQKKKKMMMKKAHK